MDKRRWMRLPEESAQAYQAFRAYLEAGPDRSIVAAAYRTLKEVPDGVPVKVPGYINAWAKQYSWQERAVARDQIFNRLAIVGPLKERAAADKRTVETANRLHDIIESELEVLEDMIDRRWKFGGAPVDKSAKLGQPCGGAQRHGRGRSDGPGKGGI